MTKKELEAALEVLMKERARRHQFDADHGAAQPLATEIAPKGVKAVKGANADGKPIWETFHAISVTPTLEVRAAFKSGVGGSVQTVRTDGFADGKTAYYSFGRNPAEQLASLSALGITTPAPLASALVKAAEVGRETFGERWTNKR